MSDIRIIVFIVALLVAAPWAMTGASSAQEQATSQAGPPVEAVREAQALLAGLGYAPGSTGASLRLRPFFLSISQLPLATIRQCLLHGIGALNL